MEHFEGIDMQNLIKIAKETRQRMFGLESPDIVSVNDAINFIRVAGSHNTGVEFPLTYRKQIGNTVFRITVLK